MRPDAAFIILFALTAILFIVSRLSGFLLGYVGSLHIGLFAVALYFLYERDLGALLARLGIPGDMRANALYTVAGLAAILVSLVLMTLAFGYLGLDDQGNVVSIANGLPLEVLALAIVLAPLTEELFFRAFLSPRIGIVASSLLFGIFHVAYGSVVEIAGAFVIGMILAAMFRKSGSLVPPMAAHLAYNLVSILVIRGFV